MAGGYVSMELDQSGRCKPLCGWIGFFLLGACCILAGQGPLTPAWQLVKITDTDSYACGLVECAHYVDGKKTSPVVVFPDTEIDTSVATNQVLCNLAKSVTKYDWCARYNAIVHAHKACIALCYLASAMFALATVIAAAGVLGSYKRSRKQAGFLSLLGGLTCAAAMVTYATTIAGVNIDKDNVTDTDWSSFHFGFSFFGVALAAAGGLFTAFAHICACGPCKR